MINVRNKGTIEIFGLKPHILQVIGQWMVDIYVHKKLTICRTTVDTLDKTTGTLCVTHFSFLSTNRVLLTKLA